MPAPVITVENLGKRYRIQHQQPERFLRGQRTEDRGQRADFRSPISDVRSPLSGLRTPISALRPPASAPPAQEDFWALKDVTFEVQQGEVVGIIGRKAGFRGISLFESRRSREAEFMTRDELLQRIWIDPERCGGKPCIRGHRIWVSLIVDLLATGTPEDEILKDYPGIERDDIRACLAYASEMSRERFVAVPLEKAS